MSGTDRVVLLAVVRLILAFACEQALPRACHTARPQQLSGRGRCKKAFNGGSG
jgi:hypothetical protein